MFTIVYMRQKSCKQQCSLKLPTANKIIFFSLRQIESTLQNSFRHLKDFKSIVKSMWIRGRVVKALSLGFKGPEFDPSVRPSVVKIANHY